MKLGLIIGKFSPLHNGSLTLCKVSQALTANLVIIVIEAKNDPIALALRIDWLKKEFPNAIITKIAEENLLPDANKLKFVLDSISKKIAACEFHLYSSNSAASDLAEALKIKCTILDPDRLAQNIRSENLLRNPYGSWFDMPFSVRSTLIRRVVLIGPESVGKSTLAKKIKHSFSPQPFLPEYGRPYEIFREPGPYQDKEFETIANVHATHRKVLMPLSGPIFLEDTDELATAVWVEMLMQKTLKSIEMKIKLPYLYLLMDPTVPFTSEKIRYFDTAKRVEFFEKIKNKLNQYNASFQVLTGSWTDREIVAKNIIKKLLLETPNWSKLGKKDPWI